MSIETTTPIALYILNRLALALIAVVRFHAGNAVIASFGPKLVPMAEQFNGSYTRIGVLKGERAALVRASAQATSALYNATMSWFGRVITDLPDFDPRGFGSRPEVTLDVLTNARRLLQAVEAKGAELTYGQALTSELGALVADAETAHAQAQDKRRELQALQAQTRELGTELHRNLVAFRRTVRSELGPSHVDSQRLRVERGRTEPEETTETEEVADTEPAQVAPSAPVATPGNGHSRPPSVQ